MPFLNNQTEILNTTSERTISTAEPEISTTIFNETDYVDGVNRSHPGFSIIVFIEAIAILINIILMIRCYKTPKKLNTALILSLSLCDVFQALSLIVFMFTLNLAEPKICRLNLGLSFFNFTSFFCILLLLSLERLLATTLYHIRIRDTLQKFKYLIINGSLALVFCYMMVIAFLIPGKRVVVNCSIRTLYGSYSDVVLISAFGPIVLTLILLLSSVAATSIRIYRRYIEKRKKSITKMTTIYFNQIDKIESVKISTIASFDRIPQPDAKPNKDYWEIRALKTLIFIFLTTVMFNVPFISTYIVEFILGHISREARLMAIIPYVFNGILDPFIYAWRNPEIRKAMRMCKKGQ